MENASFVVYPLRLSTSQRAATENSGASRRVLNVQLKELESHELVAKVIYPVLPPKVEYYLTDFGQSMIPIIGAVGQWGDQHEERLRALIVKTMQS